jgi:hypothetical protein
MTLRTAKGALEVGQVIGVVLCLLTLSGCLTQTEITWTYTPGQGWSGPECTSDLGPILQTDSAWVKDRAKVSVIQT